jgi:hypothetical protein
MQEIITDTQMCNTFQFDNLEQSGIRVLGPLYIPLTVGPFGAEEEAEAGAGTLFRDLFSLGSTFVL